MVQPFVSHEIIDRGSLCRVVIENLRDQVASAVCDLDIIRESVGVHSNSLVCRLYVRSLKGRLADNQRIDDDTDRPNVDFVRVTLFTFQHFGRNIVRGTTDGTLALTIELEFRCQTEITDLHLHFVVEEEVSKLQISVDDAMTVEVLDSRADLVDVALNLELVQSLTPTQKLVERLVLAELEQDVDVLGVLEEVLEADDVVLVQRAMNLDLGHELLLGSGLRQCALHDDFGGADSLVLQIGELEAAGEATLAEELALEVLLDADLAVVFDDFLFDDGLGAIDAFLGVRLLHCMDYFMFFLLVINLASN